MSCEAAGASFSADFPSMVVVANGSSSSIVAAPTGSGGGPARSSFGGSSGDCFAKLAGVDFSTAHHSAELHVSPMRGASLCQNAPSSDRVIPALTASSKAACSKPRPRSA